MRIKWFSRNETKQNHSPTLISRLLFRVNEKLVLFAVWLAEKTTPYSARKKKALLFLFCVAFVSGSVLVIGHSFQKRAKPAYAVTPIHVMPLAQEEQRLPVAIPELARIHRYTVYLDSLNRSEDGRKARDSLLFARPHLLDTLKYLEGLYREEIKMKYNGTTH